VLRDRLTITLNPELVKAVDLLVDRQTIRNRSHAIERVLQEGLALRHFRRAFLFLDSQTTALTIEAVFPLLTGSSMSELILCPLPGASETVLQAAKIRGADFPTLSVTECIGQFGSGGALLLQKEQLKYDFAVLFPSLMVAPLPGSLIPLYTAHRQGNSHATLLLAAKNTEFIWNGIAVLSPESLSFLPMGASELGDTLFPLLQKEGRLGVVT
jgi:hypothetical protein